MENGMLQIEVEGQADRLWTLTPSGSPTSLSIGAPRFRLDGQQVTAAITDISPERPPRPIATGATEYALTGRFSDDPALSLRLTFRIAPDCPIVRFRYTLLSRIPRTLTKSEGRDDLTYFSLSLPAGGHSTEVRLSEFNSLFHSFLPSEHPIPATSFLERLSVMGPIIVSTNADKTFTMLAAYEHGSEYPEAFMEFALHPDSRVSARAVKGNYWDGRIVGPDQPFESLWFEVAALNGAPDAMAHAMRDFILRYQADNNASRTPYIFYNTWAYQERNKWWNGEQYLSSMHQDRILAEIDVAHRMGIDVFVIDTGWYAKTGDWEVNRKRFADGLRVVRTRLEGYHMRLGLWFNPLAAALSSRMLSEHRDCITMLDGRENPPRPVWETEESVRLCPVSRYADSFAEELIRLVREVGVTYFKWDAISQYGCDAPGHLHGTAGNPAGERAECYAFEQVRALTHIAATVSAACPEAIVDFDITEGGRAVGLAWLAAGKYFLVNNGPYFPSYDIRDLTNRWSNIFVHPGPARGWICRAPLSFDRWIPSVLFLTHYLPDPPADSQVINIASLILGQNGIWGDLLQLTDGDIDRFARLLSWYKQVRDDITASFPVWEGQVGGSPEVHEKLSSDTGRGAVVIFATSPGAYTYITANRATDPWRTVGDVEVRPAHEGRVCISARFDMTGAAIVFFGVAHDSKPSV